MVMGCIMKKLIVVLAVVFSASCGDEVARFFKCDDVCQKLTRDCLSFLPYRSVGELEEECEENCKEEASSEFLNCVERHTCGEVYLGQLCWD